VNKEAIWLLTILATLFLSSCSLPLELRLFNNTPNKVIVELREERITIEPGRFGAISGVSYANFSTVTDHHTSNYEMPSVLSSTWVWKGWGPFSRRVIYTQLQANGEIWVVDPDDSSPVTAFGKQPDGFPIQPNT
jgi:hypothetical protein